MSSLIRATSLWGFEQLVETLGGKPERLLARFNLPPSSARNDDTFVSYRSAALMLESAAAELDCCDFGIRLACYQGLEMLGPIAIIARNSPTLLDAHRAIARYLHVHCPALVSRVIYTSNRQFVKLDYRITELSTSRLRQAYELSLANTLEILRFLAGYAATPEAVAFLHPPVGSPDIYQQFFGTQVLFNQPWCGLVIPVKLAEKAIDHADRLTLEYAVRFLDVRGTGDDCGLASHVTELIHRLLPSGACTIETIATELHLHPRSLQRRLALEGYRYADILDNARQQLARSYLSDSRLPLSQITGLLGYTEQSTFNSACRRWFGTTPRRFRLDHLPPAPKQLR